MMTEVYINQYSLNRPFGITNEIGNTTAQKAYSYEIKTCNEL